MTSLILIVEWILLIIWCCRDGDTDQNRSANRVFRKEDENIRWKAPIHDKDFPTLFNLEPDL